MAIKVNNTNVIDDAGNINVGIATVSNIRATNINATGISTVGILTGAASIQASVFYGSGANLTNLNIPSSYIELDGMLFQ